MKTLVPTYRHLLRIPDHAEGFDRREHLKPGKCYVYIGITSCDYKISQL